MMYCCLAMAVMSRVYGLERMRNVHEAADNRVFWNLCWLCRCCSLCHQSMSTQYFLGALPIAKLL